MYMTDDLSRDVSGQPSKTVIAIDEDTGQTYEVVSADGKNPHEFRLRISRIAANDDVDASDASD